MMAETYKYSLFSVLLLAFTGVFAVCILCGCSSSNKMINTRQMPGHRFSDIIQSPGAVPERQSSNKAISRTKTGVYIYKDDSVTNTTGYNFKYRDKTDVGPTDVRFDAENFRTRY